MAKVGLFLRGARGKFAGSVLQKGEKGTIIRENVKAANPQTEKQMLQRIAFATVALAAKYMIPIIGQSFEGRPNQKENRRAFIKANVEKLKNEFIKYNGLGNAPAVSPDLSSALGKGVSTLVPNGYQVSNGTLLCPEWLRIYRSTENAFTCDGNINQSMDVAIGDTVNPALVLGLLGLHVGDQITAVGVLTRNGEDNIISFPNSGGDYNRYGKVAASRLVFDADEDWWADQSVELESAENLEQFKRQLATAIGNCINKEKSDLIFVDAFLRELENGMAVTHETGSDDVVITMNGILSANFINRDHILGNPQVEPWKLKAAGYFISNFKNNGWQYSTCELAELAPGTIDNVNTYHGARFLMAQESYIKAGSADSNLYTRRGGDVNVIS